MKKIIIAMSVFALAACKKNEGTVENKTATSSEVTTGNEKVSKQAKEEFEKLDLNKLKSATPATEAQLESALPKEINGLPAKKAPGTSTEKQMVAAMYMDKNDPMKMYSAVIVDAAGQNAEKYNAEYEKYNKDEFVKEMQKHSNLSSEIIGGNRVIFNEMDLGSGIKGSAANFMVKKRYSVIISGPGLSKESIKDVISKMDFSQLPE